MQDEARLDMTELSITRIGIDGFRGLRALSLDGLGQINILVGGNNSGKTSVLEALAIVCQPSNPEEWLAMVRRRDFGGLDESRLQSLRWCFTRDHVIPDPDEPIAAACRFDCEGAFPLRALHAKYTEFMGIPTEEEARRLDSYVDPFNSEAGPMRKAELVQHPQWDESSETDRFYGRTPIDPGPQALQLWEYERERRSPTQRGIRIDCKILTPYSYQINRIQVRSQSRQILQSDSELAVELLRDFDADIEGIDLASFSGERPAIYLKHRRLGIAPISVFGDAMRRSVLLAATLPTLKDGGLLLIDEVETGIHVSALGQVFSWLVTSARKLGVQVFVITHSLEALDALAAASAIDATNDVVAFHLTQTEGRTECKRFAGDLLRRLRFERGLDLR
jgi:energy-coupling factor transporter ATP-binding protein EcfA2